MHLSEEPAITERTDCQLIVKTLFRYPIYNYNDETPNKLWITL